DLPGLKREPHSNKSDAGLEALALPESLTPLFRVSGVKGIYGTFQNGLYRATLSLGTKSCRKSTLFAHSGFGFALVLTREYARWKRAKHSAGPVLIL
ncbi:hypothetical protein, partial [Rhizobium laguerreae]|uniref:hypothetical protein n=1 Tax=Rhizobium laguerreae TaxID=1076926 RepID=UPI00197F0E31